MPSQCFLHVGITFTRFSRATISLQGLPFRPRTLPRTWFWDPTCLLGSELWKASPGLPTADRSEKVLSREAQAGSRPKPGPWTHFSSWLSSRFTRLLTACLQLARPGPNSYPIHRANPGRAFCLPRRKKQNGTELAWSQMERSSVTMSLLLRDHKKPTFTQVAATTNLHLSSVTVLPPKI